MSTGLIGHTGFVGSNLLGQRTFDETYSSANIAQIRGRRFDLLVNSGVSAVKWRANEEPERDREAILALWRELETVEVDLFVQISTLDVMPRPGPAYEDTPIDESLLEPYGRNRLELERLVAERFPRRLVVRLPHLFGSGLKKGFVYDLIHSNALHLTDRRDVFQLYDLAWLWRDVSSSVAEGWDLVNVSSEPLTAAEVAELAFGIEFGNLTDREPRLYDVRTRHAYRGGPGYMYSRDEVVEGLRRFREQP